MAECINEFKGQIEVDTKLDAVIKATGQQYIATTREIKQYASELQKVTRFGDDTIESTAALLLATKKFDKEGLQRTIELSADLAEAMGEDLPSAAKTLERALIEPGEGLSRLKSIGISFTDAEEEMIQSLNEAGKSFEAQQIILDKVEAAYGGIAESVASLDTSTLDKIKNVWGDIKEDLGNVFTNTLGPIFDWIYRTLTWLQRLTNQVAERSNFNKYLKEGNIQALADNFTTELLNDRLTEAYKDYTKAIELLTDNNYIEVMWDIEEKFGLNIEQFLDKSLEEQEKILRSVNVRDDQWAGLWNIMELAYDATTILKAIAKQQRDIADANERLYFKTQQEQNDALITAAGGIKGIFDKATTNAVKALVGAIELEDGTIGTAVGKFILDNYLGTGISDSSYMSIMYGKLGEWSLNTDAAMIALNDWAEWVEDLTEKYSFNKAGANGLFNYTVTPSKFDLSNDKLSMFNFGNSNLYGQGINGYDTLSILGPKGASSLNIVPKAVVDLSDNIKNALNQYGSRSESYQLALLDTQIDQIESILNSLAGEDSPLYTYLSEILDGLKKDRDSRTTSKSTTISTQIQDGIAGFFKDSGLTEDDDQAKAGAAGVINAVTSNLGEFGQVVSELITNMSTMGPLIGAIVTALKYVIQGFAEVLGDWLSEFLYYGLEPLKEFGRMIANVLMPILEEIMPSIQDSAEFLISVFNIIGTVLRPIAVFIGSVLGPALKTITSILNYIIVPVLKAIASIILVVTSAFEWAAGWIRYAVAKVVNFFGGNMDDSRPGSYTDILQGHMNELWEGTSADYSYGSSGTTNASYQGSTTVYLNVYQNGVVVGDGGIQEFAVIIRNELENLNYYHR